MSFIDRKGANLMNTAIILAGGTGTRLGANIPKQYIEINHQPIIAYCLKTFEISEIIDAIVIVAAPAWQESIAKWISQYGITKFKGFANAGSSRQHSILNGLVKAKELSFEEKDGVIIHDAARPNLTNEMIASCMEALASYDGVMPVLPVKDTIYLSQDGTNITSLLNRDQLYAGQAPEAFNLIKYYHLHDGMTEEDLEMVRGSSEIAYRHGLSVKLIAGDEHNYKITTAADLEKFQTEVGEK